MKSYDHLNFSRAFVVQFWASRYIISPNRTSAWKVMTTWILESFRFSISSFSICYAITSNIRGKSYDSLNFSRASVDQLRASRYVMRLNQTSQWKVMTIWLSRELPLFNFERLDILSALLKHSSEKLWPYVFQEILRLDILCPWNEHPCEMLWPLEFSRAAIVQFRASRYVKRLNRTLELKVMTV